MFLIMSGAYVTQELRAEFGAIPPSFLPLGNRRLFQQQIKQAPAGKQIYLSVPNSYEISRVDEQWLASNKIQLILTPSNLSLGEALVTCLNLIEEPLTSSLSLLFGDTLLGSTPVGEDIIATSEVADNYKWSTISDGRIGWSSEADKSNNVICGYFNFSQPRKLLRDITLERWDFIKGISRYQSEQGLCELRVSDWYDFGHVNTYYHSKAAFTTQRAFNELEINPVYIQKSSVKSDKIRAEANWFESLPPMLRAYTPQYLGSREDELGKFSYCLEYLHNTALNELFVFSEIPSYIWDKIFGHCIDFIDSCRAEKANNTDSSEQLSQLFGDKTDSRLREYCESKNIDVSEPWHFNDTIQCSIKDILDMSERYLPQASGTPTLMHGDFCFSNILYDFRTNRVKTIDPRGITPSGEVSIYGDMHYDIAKLSHSILGMYDWIIAGYHETKIDMDSRQIQFEISCQQKHKHTQAMFLEKISRHYKLSPLKLYAMQLQLFLSMLPLHSDDENRQNALFANAFRIFEIMKRYEK